MISMSDLAKPADSSLPARYCAKAGTWFLPSTVCVAIAWRNMSIVSGMACAVVSAAAIEEQPNAKARQAANDVRYMNMAMLPTRKGISVAPNQDARTGKRSRRILHRLDLDLQAHFHVHAERLAGIDPEVRAIEGGRSLRAAALARFHQHVGHALEMLDLQVQRTRDAVQREFPDHARGCAIDE